MRLWEGSERACGPVWSEAWPSSRCEPSTRSWSTAAISRLPLDPRRHPLGTNSRFSRYRPPRGRLWQRTEMQGSSAREAPMGLVRSAALTLDDLLEDVVQAGERGDIAVP